MKKSIILCVDDEASVLSALRILLSDTLEGKHTIEIAESGEEALEVCEELRREGLEISVIISDFIMPGMNGDELLVRLQKISSNTVKIMLTGQSDIQGVKRAINEANLYRFLEKPFNNSDLMLTVKSALEAYHRERELELRNRELETINNSLEQLVKDRTSALNKSLSVIKKDLTLAKKIQKSILTVKPALFKELNIHSTYIPMSEVGGDFYDISKVNEHTYRIFQADATGHGVQAAMITMAVKGIFDNIKNFDLETSQIMDIFNNEYMNKYESLNSFMTAVLIDINVQNHTLQYVSAGHPAAVLIKSSQEQMYLKSTGKMIGILKNINYKSAVLDFTLADRLYVFTDGLFEEFNWEKEEFGEEKLYSILAENNHLTFEEVVKKALTGLQQFLEGRELQDDITMLGIELKNNYEK